jgi:hypothetical protein
MKKQFMLACLFLLGIPFAQAQSNVEEIDFIQSIIGAEKKQITSMFINVDGPEGETFWNLYDEYEAKRKAFGKERFGLIKQYVEEYEGITDEQTDALMRRAIKLRKSSDRLVDSYYKKMRRKVGPKVAAQFYQLESFIQAEIRAELFENIPMIDELDD